MVRMGSRHLRESIGRLVRRKEGFKATADMPLEALIKLRMEHLEKQLEELKGRVNGLLLTFAGAVVADLSMRLLG